MTTPPPLDLRQEPLVLLINTRCGHVASIGNEGTRTAMEGRRADLALAGHTGWVVETRPATDTEILGLAAGTKCPTCQVTPPRGHR